MTEIFGVPTQALFSQLLIGLINGAFYAMLSLGLAIIFGLLNIINFTHGAQYMMGAFCAWFLLQYLGLGYWWSLLLAPIIVGATGVIIEDYSELTDTAERGHEWAPVHRWAVALDDGRLVFADTADLTIEPGSPRSGPGADATG